MNIIVPENAGLLAYLAARKAYAPAFAPADAAEDPYMGCGCHPDIVERLWDRIGAGLPTDCRGLVHGTPALVHAASGVALGICIGTQYALRLPGSLGEDAVTAGANTITTWSTGGTLDIRREFGDDWVFGAWLKEEPAWCAEAYRLLGIPGG